MTKHTICAILKRTALQLRGLVVTCIKKSWVPLAIVVIVMAIVFSLFRALTPWVKQYKGDVEQHLSLLLGQPVTIQDLETSWYWFEPVLRMDQVTLSDQQDHVLKLDKLLVGINLFSSLWHWQVEPGVLYVDDVHLNLRQVKQHWEVDGLNQSQHAMTIDPTSYLPVLSWLLAQHKIVIKHVSAMIHFNDGSFLPVNELNFTAVHAYGHYQLSGHAKLAQAVHTELAIIADLQLDPLALTKLSGRAYVSAQHVCPTQWRNFLPTMPYQIKRGEGNIELWLDLTQGRLTNLQSKVSLQSLSWREDGKAKPRSIESLQANMAWKVQRDGWQLSADQIQLRVGGVTWPENALSLEYKSSQQGYRAFVKTLLLDSVLSADVTWPDSIQPLLKMAPGGELHDLQVGVKDNQLDYLLTKFTQLSWKARAQIPAVSHLSGVLYWQPTEGRLEFDGENTVIAPRGLPALTFKLFNAAFDWKELSDGLRVTMERFVLSHPNLLLSAQGAVDNASSTSASHVRLTADFAGKQVQKLLPYLPEKYLKQKLNTWLKQDVKRIAALSGRLVINGPLANFPFDTQPGEFSITSHLSGVDLAINNRWPLNRDIDADLRIDKRKLEADIFHAKLQGTVVDKINLAIPDIGLGHEALLLHGEVEASAANIKAYVLASPLRDKLLTLQVVDVHDLLGLNLQLDIPLYPERDQVLARGALFFDDNQAIVHQLVSDLELEHVTGVMRFDEHGLSGGGLQGTLGNFPISMQVQSMLEPKPYTEIKIQGSTTMELLRQKVAFPLLALMDGRINLESVLTLPQDKTAINRLHVTSSLEGVAVDLPSPLGKKSTDAVPIAIDVAFIPNHTQEIQLSYIERLSGALLLDSSKGNMAFKKGELRFGKGHAKLPEQVGLNIVGTLPAFEVGQWQQVAAKLPNKGSLSTMQDNINLVDLQFNQSVLRGHDYKDLRITAKQAAKNDWMINLTQKDIVAQLHYQPKRNLLSGHFEHIFIEKTPIEKRHINEPTATLKPRDIPNLDVSVDELKWGNVMVGKAYVKSTSTDTQWVLDDCNITAPEYQLRLQGHWTQDAKKNQTIMNADLHMTDLSKSLERWQITPAVQAKQGDIRFQGEWKGGLQNFTLEKVDGNVQMIFKNGRISHFDRETEEKLGLGKLLSILSLQTIPRRLTLDFSDLSQQGYSFDIFKGHFKLQHGIMSTQDSYIDGPVAFASMKGDLDIIKHLYDVDLRVSPYIGASLPVVATIAGGPVAGPIAGIATWVAMNIINKGMQKVSGYTYKVSGPWLEPVVQQVSIDRRK